MNQDMIAVELGKEYSIEDIRALIEDEAEGLPGKHKYGRIVLVAELKRIKEDIGIIKGVYYTGDTLDYQGSLLLPILPQNSPQEQGPWTDLPPGESKFFALLLDSREPKLLEKVGAFFSRSFEGSRLQDFIPGLGSRKGD